MEREQGSARAGLRSGGDVLGKKQAVPPVSSLSPTEELKDTSSGHDRLPLWLRLSPLGTMVLDLTPSPAKLPLPSILPASFSDAVY